jgi:hypothetical protein
MTKKSKKPPGKSRPARAPALKSAPKAAPAKSKVPAKSKASAETKARAGTKPPAKRKPPTMLPRDSLDDFIDVSARTLGLPVEPEWLPAIKASLDVTLRLGALVAAFELPDEAEPAPIFGA